MSATSGSPEIPLPFGQKGTLMDNNHQDSSTPRIGQPVPLPSPQPVAPIMSEADLRNLIYGETRRAVYDQSGSIAEAIKSKNEGFWDRAWKYGLAAGAGAAATGMGVFIYSKAKGQ